MDFENDTKKSFYGYFLETQAGVFSAPSLTLFGICTDFLAGLEAQIRRLSVIDASARPEAIDACLAAISRLSDVVKDASSYLPAYDQRSYSEVRNRSRL